MPEEATGLAAKEFYALIIAQGERRLRTLAKFLTLLLNYRHGFTVEPAEDFIQAAGAIRRHGRRIRSVFVIQNNTVSARTTVPALTLGGSIPLFLLLPGREANEQRESVEGTDNVFVCAWEMAFASGEDSLQRILGEALAEVNLEGLLDDDTEGLEHRVKDRGCQSRRFTPARCCPRRSGGDRRLLDRPGPLRMAVTLRRPGDPPAHHQRTMGGDRCGSFGDHRQGARVASAH